MDRLRHLERLGLFLPILRVYRFDVTVKIELVDGGQLYRDLGELKAGEAWDGEVLTELAQFDFWPSVYSELARRRLRMGSAWAFIISRGHD